MNLNSDKFQFDGYPDVSAFFFSLSCWR